MGNKIRRECLASLTTFISMAYVFIVHPQILALTGMDEEAVLLASIITTAMMTIACAVSTNAPFVIGPAMGINVYFAYEMVLKGGLTWQAGLGICLVIGLIFFLLNCLGLRVKLLHMIPESIKIGLIGGIGLFLSCVGLLSIHVIEYSSGWIKLDTPLSYEALLSLFGLILTLLLMRKNIQGAILISILVTWMMGWLVGAASFEKLKMSLPALSPTFLKADVTTIWKWKNLQYFFSLFVIILFDSAGSLLSLYAKLPGLKPRYKQAFTSDSLATCVGALLGTTPLTFYLESATGIASGGTTGLTALFCALFTLLLYFFYPFIVQIPLFATAPALIIVGGEMASIMATFKWKNRSKWLPAISIFITIPFLLDITTGIGVGLLLYPICHFLTKEPSGYQPKELIFALIGTIILGLKWS